MALETHAYWRLLFQSGAGNEIDLNEVEFFDTLNIDATAATGGTPIAGEIYSGGYPASAAFDGNYASDGWASSAAATFGSTKWIGYQFPAPVAVLAFSIFPYVSGYYPHSFDLQYSDDGAAWTTLASYPFTDADFWSGATGIPGRASRVCQPPTLSGPGFRYWRMNVSATNGGTSEVDAYQIEFRKLGTALHSSHSTPPIVSSFYSSGFPPTYYADKTGTNDFATDGSGLPQWMGYDFGERVQPDELYFKCYSNSHAPKDFTIEGSDDASSWTVVETITGEPDWAGGEVRTYEIGSSSSSGASEGFPDPRMTRVTRLVVGADTTPDARSTRMARLVIAGTVPPLHVTRVTRLVVADGVPCVTAWTQAVRITRLDGVVHRYTALDIPLKWGGFVYKACPSILPSASQSQTDVGGIGSIELSGALARDGVDEADLYGGLFDDAFVEVWEVDYEGTQSPKRLASGWVGNIKFGTKGYVIEVVGGGARIQQLSLVNTYAPTCRWKFGGKECGFDIEGAKMLGTITSASDRGVFVAEVGVSSSGASEFSGASADDEGGGRQWADGIVRWTSGRNIGVETEIQTAVFVGAEVTVTLWVVAPFFPEPGDEFDLLPGCDLTRDGGCTLYKRVVNFGGFPDVPGGDVLQATPNASV